MKMTGRVQLNGRQKTKTVKWTKAGRIFCYIVVAIVAAVLVAVPAIIYWGLKWALI